MLIENRELRVPSLFFSFHRISTVRIWANTLLLVALLGSCTRDSGAGKPDRTVAGPRKTGDQAPEKETAAQLSYRLRPHLELADPSEGHPEQDLAPLLSLTKETPLRVRMVLAYGGIEKIPSSKELREMEALSTPIWTRVAENLKNLQRQDPPIRPKVFAIDKKISAYKVPIDRPGAEALLLLPELWEALDFGKPLVAALPDRGGLFFIVDEPENIKTWALTLQEIMGQASNPMCDRFLLRKDGKLLPGKTFEEAGRD